MRTSTNLIEQSIGLYNILVSKKPVGLNPSE